MTSRANGRNINTISGINNILNGMLISFMKIWNCMKPTPQFFLIHRMLKNKLMTFMNWFILCTTIFKNHGNKTTKSYRSHAG